MATKLMQSQNLTQAGLIANNLKTEEERSTQVGYNTGPITSTQGKMAGMVILLHLLPFPELEPAVKTKNELAATNNLMAAPSWIQLRKFRDNTKAVGNNYLKDIWTVGSRRCSSSNI